MTIHPCLAFVLFFLSVMACGPTMPPRYRQYILEKVPHDLQCEREQIHIRQQPQKHVYSVYGCGARAVYRVDCNERHECEAQLVEVPVPIRTETENQSQ